LGNPALISSFPDHPGGPGQNWLSISGNDEVRMGVDAVDEVDAWNQFCHLITCRDGISTPTLKKW